MIIIGTGLYTFLREHRIVMQNRKNAEVTT
jgi:hypothetical protein